MAWFAGAGYLALVIFLFLGVLKPQSAKLKAIKGDIKNANFKRRYFSDFKKFVQQSEKHEETVEDVVRNFYDNLMSKDKTEVTIMEIIEKITKATGIRIDRFNLTPVGSSSKSKSGYEKQVWRFDFLADYKKVLKFVNLLESNPVFFGINNMSISSGRENPLHNVSMSIYTVIPTMNLKTKKSRYEVLDSTEVFSLHINSVIVANRIKNKIAKSAVKLSKSKKDPMFFRGTILPKKEEKPVVIKRKPMPELTLEGIIWDPQKPMVIINGKVLSKGDFIQGVKVVKITETNVTVQWDKRWHKLKLKE